MCPKETLLALSLSLRRAFSSPKIQFFTTTVTQSEDPITLHFSHTAREFLDVLYLEYLYRGSLTRNQSSVSLTNP